MTKDCQQCHRLFYPTLISSRSSNYVNSLKAKTTISPVITTLRTIAVMQRNKRKNGDSLPRPKLSKSSYTVNHLDSQPGPTAKRTQGLFEYDDRQFKQGIFSSLESQHLHVGSNRFFVGLDHDASRHKQDKRAKQVANHADLSQASSNSNTCTNTQSDYDRRNNRYRTSDYRYHKEKENCGGSRKQSFGASNWKVLVRPIPTEQAFWFNPNHSPKIAISEDRDQLLFTMSPFSTTHTLSTFMSSSAENPENHQSAKNLDRKKTKSDDVAQESDDDEDERLISITSVLPIDIIPQSHKST